MTPKERLIWRYAIAFLSAYRPLRYDGVPLAPLLLRHVQRYLAKRIGSLKRGPTLPSIAPPRLQQSCASAFPQPTPDYGKEGVTIVRSQLYLVTEGIDDESFIYIAHHRKEYRKMRRLKKCRPLIYFPALKEAKIAAKEERIVWRAWRIVCNSRRTPAIFRSLTFRRWMRLKLKQTLRNIRKVRTLFKRYPVARLIYGSTINPQGSLLSTYAQTRNVPVVNIQHGIFGPLGHLPVNADLNFVWGPSHAAFLQKHGAKPHNIIVSGPFFYRNVEQTCRARIAGSGRPLPLLLVALQPLGHVFNRTLIQCVEKAAGRLRLRVAYKLHPDQGSGAAYRSLVKRKRSELIRHGTVPLPQLFTEAKLVVTPFSSVAYEALLHGIPILFYGRRKRIYYLRQTPPFFRTAEQLRPVLLRIARDPVGAPSNLMRRQRLSDGGAARLLADRDPQQTIWSVLKQKKEEAVSSCQVWPSSPLAPDQKDCRVKTS